MHVQETMMGFLFLDRAERKDMARFDIDINLYFRLLNNYNSSSSDTSTSPKNTCVHQN